ncbi:MAG: hypothetical protein ABIU20_08580 [Blastocatellia bacterium]
MPVRVGQSQPPDMDVASLSNIETAESIAWVTPMWNKDAIFFHT